LLDFINNPLDRPVSSIAYPYSLSLTPPLLSKYGIKPHSIQIIISSLDNNANFKYIRLLVVDPLGEACESHIKIHLDRNLTFPDDFASCTLLQGNYSVILIENNSNQTLTTLRFDVVFSPMLYSFGTFAFKDGLPITIGLFISALTTVYQFATTRNQDRNRLSENEAKWMLDNGKYYFTIHNCAAFITNSFFSGEDYTNFDKNRILYGMIKFYAANTIYEDKVNMFYFDNVLAETFLTKLYGRILYHRYEQFMNDKNEKDLSYLTELNEKNIMS
jgi:hypothetical protein